jgi:hypothetical protein
LNLPLTGGVDSLAESRIVCTLGAFEISVSDHHGMNQKAVDVTYLLSSLGDTNLNQILVSFVRVNALLLIRPGMSSPSSNSASN